MIVVDTNIISYLFIPTTSTYQAEKALWKDYVWVAPLLWRSEFRNVLIKYIRAGKLSLDDGIEIMADSLLMMADREYQIESDHVLKLAESSGCSAYDCEFVALAEELNVSLVTVDRQILAAFPQRAISLEKFANN